MAVFRFKRFEADDSLCAMKIGTDAVLLGSWMEICPPEPCKPLKMLDIGCGCGIIALMAAQRSAGICGAAENTCTTPACPSFAIEGIDIDPSAVEASASNFAASPWASCLSARTVSLEDFAASAPEGSFDLLFSNPPYFDKSLASATAERTAARDSASMPRSQIISASLRLLGPCGSLALILPAEQAKDFIVEATCSGLALQRQCFVKTTERKPARRMMLQFTRRPLGTFGPVRTETLVIGSDEYRHLTEGFYL